MRYFGQKMSFRQNEPIPTKKYDQCCNEKNYFYSTYFNSFALIIFGILIDLNPKNTWDLKKNVV